MQKRSFLFFILSVIFVASSFFAILNFKTVLSNASSLNNDQQKIYNFLVQVNPETGYSNAEVLGFTDLEEPSTWAPKFAFNGSRRLTSVSIGDNSGVYGFLDVSGCTVLTSLSCQRNFITGLNLSGCTSLTTLFCGGNHITELDVTENTLLTIIWCFNNLLTELDVTNNTLLKYLSCSNNQLTELNVTNNTLLTNFDCFNNFLTELDITNNVLLTSVWCNENQLTELDTSNNTALITLWCHKNRLAELNVTTNTALESFACSDNQLSVLDISNCMSLTSLWCDGNNLTELNATNNALLSTLSCSNNQLSEIDLSYCTSLTSLYLPNNRLAELDLTNNTSLISVYCSNNQLQELDLTFCTLLERVIVFNNCDLDISNIIERKFRCFAYTDTSNGFVYCRSWNEHLGVDYWLTAKCIGLKNIVYIESDLFLHYDDERFMAYIGFEFEPGFGLKEWHDADGLFDVEYAEYISETIWGEINADVELAIEGTEKAASITLVFDIVNYQINYQLPDGVGNQNPSFYTYGSGLVLQDPETKEGYRFDGWWDAEVGGNRITEIGGKETGDKTLWARWVAINTFNIIYEGVPNDMMNPNPDFCVEGDVVILKNLSKRKGYKFLGWFDAESGGNKVSAVSGCEDEITLWARWKVQQTKAIPDSSILVLAILVLTSVSAGTVLLSYTIRRKKINSKKLHQ